MKAVPLPYSNGTIITADAIVDRVVKRLIGFSNEPNDGLSALWNKLFLAERIKQNGISINEKRTHGEDWQFCVEFYAKCRSIGFSSFCFYHYIHHSENSLVNRFRPNAFQLSVETTQLFRLLYPFLPWSSEHAIEELRQLPVKMALYYRLNRKKNSLLSYYSDMLSTCRESYDFLFASDEKYEWESRLRQSISENDLKLFRKTLNRQTNMAFISEKLKNRLRLIKHQIKRFVK